MSNDNKKRFLIEELETATEDQVNAICVYLMTGSLQAVQPPAAPTAPPPEFSSAPAKSRRPNGIRGKQTGSREYLPVVPAAKLIGKGVRFTTEECLKFMRDREIAGGIRLPKDQAVALALTHSNLSRASSSIRNFDDGTWCYGVLKKPQLVA